MYLSLPSEEEWSEKEGFKWEIALILKDKPLKAAHQGKRQDDGKLLGCELKNRRRRGRRRGQHHVSKTTTETLRCDGEMKMRLLIVSSPPPRKTAGRTGDES